MKKRLALLLAALLLFVSVGCSDQPTAASELPNEPAESAPAPAAEAAPVEETPALPESFPGTIDVAVNDSESSTAADYRAFPTREQYTKKLYVHYRVGADYPELPIRVLLDCSGALVNRWMMCGKAYPTMHSTTSSFPAPFSARV